MAHLELNNVKTDTAAALFFIRLPWCGKVENQLHLASVDQHKGIPPNLEGTLDSAWQSSENV